MKALVLVDLQNDFCPGGALPVPEGHEVIPVANGLAARFDLVVATQDWHPREHRSFAVNHKGRGPGEVVELNGRPQVLWPEHCVQGSAGAQFHGALERTRVTKVIRKGMDPGVDSYSGFFDNDRRRATPLGRLLKKRGVTDAYVCGLATDYCVKFTALDAVALGFRTWLVLDACRGVNLKPGDVDRAIEEMQAADVRVIHARQLP